MPVRRTAVAGRIPMRPGLRPVVLEPAEATRACASPRGHPPPRAPRLIPASRPRHSCQKSLAATLGMEADPDARFSGPRRVAPTLSQRPR
jgi:hypothetical protein